MEATVFLGHWLRLAEVVETVLTRIPERMVVQVAAVAGLNRYYDRRVWNGRARAQRRR